MNATLWDKRAQKYDDDIKQHNSVYDKTIHRTESLVDKSDVILDFGCASGEMSLDVAPYVQHVHGIDVSGWMIELANQKAQDRRVDNVSFSQTDAFDTKLEANAFSTIIAFSILHLVDDVSEVLGRLYNLLARGGLLISQTPCLGERSWLFKAMVQFAQKVGVAPPILSLTIPELKSLISRSKFEIIENKIWDEKDALQWIVARKT